MQLTATWGSATQLCSTTSSKGVRRARAPSGCVARQAPAHATPPPCCCWAAAPPHHHGGQQQQHHHHHHHQQQQQQQQHMDVLPSLSGLRHQPRSSSSSSSRPRRRGGLIVAAAGAAGSSSRTALLDEEEALAAGTEADNFYQILGVSCTASQRDIKRAYRNLMMDFHPDLSGDEESAEFCVLLNDIYDTLMDPERRATYDALAGFSASSINPFADTSLPADQVFVDEVTCIGCRNCTNVCPRTFAMEEDYGRARAMAQGIDSDEKLQEAIDTCPVNCIYWVTASQLSLLEATMAKMERVAVWSLMSGGGGGRDVFTEASMSWEKRQAAVRAKVQAEADAAVIWNTWFTDVAGGSAGANFYAQAADAARRAARSAAGSSGSSYASYDGGDGGSSSDEAGGSYDGGAYDGSGASAGYGSGSKEGARIAKLAAKAARAARQWKSWQELQRRGRGASLMIPSVSSASGSSLDDQG